jgi:CheY-like chemotaxis protein
MNNNDPLLLIEDNLIDVMNLKRGLKDIGAKNPLYVCSDGEVGVKFLQDSRNPKPVLIILDLHMPRMSGIEFLKIVKASPDWCIIPVIILTASQEESDLIASFELSVAGYIIKSLNYSDFVNNLSIIYRYWLLNETPQAIVDNHQENINKFSENDDK